MIRASEIIAGVYGSVLLAGRKVQGLDLFDATPRGFWRSFWALGLVAIPALLLDAVGGAFADDTAEAVVVRLIAIVIDAVAFPLVMVAVARELGRSDRYIRFIVAYNWSALLRMAAFFPVALLTVLVPPLQPLLLGVLVVMLVYEGYIARVALDVGPAAAAGIVVLDTLLDAVVGLWARQLTG